ncbi:MAG: hypothetical protein K2X27_24425 [Candidatus Obscuribacterales bacterium]|nr:hypothetical protein [Candidatus Obscuribacterales bacterium]
MGKQRRERESRFLKASTLSFDEWVDFIAADMSEIDWFSDQEDLLNKLNLFFHSGQALLDRFGQEDLNKLLWSFLGESGLLQALFNEKLELKKRIDCIRAIKTFYQDLFEKNCADLMSNGLKEFSPEHKPLNSICYMWWDIFPSWGGSEKSEQSINKTILSLLSELLTIKHLACQESALHGLGHWHLHHGAAVEKIIDKFLESKMNEQLKQYALAARSGCVN